MTSAGFVEGRMIAYWLSFDPDSHVLKYGMGHHMEETTLLTCPLPDGLCCLTETCPKLVALHGYDRPVHLRSVYEAKLSTAGCRSQVGTKPAPSHNAKFRVTLTGTDYTSKSGILQHF